MKNISFSLTTDQVKKPGVKMSSDWDDTEPNADHLRDCDVDGCERCAYLIDGFYMACDECGHWGQTETRGSWVMKDGKVFCNQECANKYFGCEVEVD